MSSYFQTLLAASVCGAVCTLLADGFEKYLKYVVSLICIVIIISPLKSIKLSDIDYNGIPDTSLPSADGVPSLYSLSCESAEKQAEEYLCEMLFAEFGIKAVYADIIIDWAKEEPTVEEIILALGSEHGEYAERVYGYFENMLGTGVKVIAV